MAASSVDTWNSLSASSTCAAVAKGSNLIFASDSEILIIASSCLQGNGIILEDLVQMYYIHHTNIQLPPFLPISHATRAKWWYGYMQL